MKKLLVLLTAIAMIGAFAFNATAYDSGSGSGGAEWQFYGSARVATFSATMDANDPNNSLSFDDRDTQWGVQTNTRTLGANVTVSETLSARIEIGAFSLRHAYGVWDFGGGKLLAGHTETPVNWGAGQVYDMDNCLNTFGVFNQDRDGQLALIFDDFKLALVDPGATVDAITADFDNNGTNDTVDTDYTFPMIVASYDLALNDFLSFKVAGAYKTMDIVNATSDREYSLDAYLGAASATLNYDEFSLTAMAGFGQNLEHLNIALADDSAGVATFSTTTSDIFDTDDFSYAVFATFKVNDMVTLGAGYSYLESELEAGDDDSCAFYFNAPITLADGVSVTPEIGKYDYKENASGADEGDKVYFGAKWQIDF